MIWKTKQLTVCQKYQYNMESKIITPNQIYSYFLELAKNPKFIDKLTEYEILEIESYAKAMLTESEKEAFNMANANPKYNYPENYKNNHLQYWLVSTHNNTDYFNCKKVLNIIETKISKSNSNPTDEKPVNQILDKNSKIIPLPNGYNSGLNQTQINFLYRQLTIHGKYIDVKTDIKHFQAIFKNTPLPNDFKTIKRNKKFTNTLLAYFISELFQKDNQNDFWSIAQICFGVNNLRQSFQNFYNTNKNHKPKGFQPFDEIFKTITTIYSKPL